MRIFLGCREQKKIISSKISKTSFGKLFCVNFSDRIYGILDMQVSVYFVWAKTSFSNMIIFFKIFSTLCGKIVSPPRPRVYQFFGPPLFLWSSYFSWIFYVWVFRLATICNWRLLTKLGFRSYFDAFLFYSFWNNHLLRRFKSCQTLPLILKFSAAYLLRRLIWIGQWFHAYGSIFVKTGCFVKIPMLETGD